MYHRIQKLPLSASETCFLWGPRQTGKSTLLQSLFPGAIQYNLLLSETYQQLLRSPELIREECLGAGLSSTIFSWNSQPTPAILRCSILFAIGGRPLVWR